MNLQQRLFNLVRKYVLENHVTDEENQRARAHLARALALNDEGDYFGAKTHALNALACIVGVDHKDYVAAQYMFPMPHERERVLRAKKSVNRKSAK